MVIAGDFGARLAEYEAWISDRKARYLADALALEESFNADYAAAMRRGNDSYAGRAGESGEMVAAVLRYCAIQQMSLRTRQYETERDTLFLEYEADMRDKIAELGLETVSDVEPGSGIDS